ncbi:MAG: hypothetical protein JWO96_844 [Candidatus Saccharibacteria bacterium]|nr:hypothetical protein [Candidatus Saccharibacteria bacterium]
MARIKFWDLFQLNPDGSIRPKKPIKIAGVVLSPETSYSKGVLFSGFDLFQYYGRDLEVEEQPGGAPSVITGIYNE